MPLAWFLFFFVFFTESFQTTHLKYAFAPNEPSPFLMSVLTIKGTLYLFLFFGGESENWKLGSENCCLIFDRKTLKKKNRRQVTSHSALFPIGGNFTNAHECGSTFDHSPGLLQFKHVRVVIVTPQCNKSNHDCN